MAPVLEKQLNSPSGPGPELAGRQPGQKLEISVVYTSDDATAAALRSAGKLAGELDGRIALVVPQIVPYPLPLSSPPVLLGFNERRFAAVAAHSPVETRVQIYLCRDREVLLGDVLRPHSLVAVGGRRRWWFSAERRLARRLSREGHEVIFVVAEERGTRE